MASTLISPQTISRAGLGPAFAAANVDGHFWPNTGQQFLHVKNGSASPITVTFPIPVTVDGQAVAARTVSVPATTGERIIGPFPTQYNDTLGNANCTFSAVTTVTCALYQFSAVS